MDTKRIPVSSHSLDKSVFRHTAKSVKALNSMKPSVQRGGIRL